MYVLKSASPNFLDFQERPRHMGRLTGSGGADQFRGTYRCAAWRIFFFLMVHLDDFCVRQPPGSDLCKPHHEHGADCEIRHDHCRRTVLLSQPPNFSHGLLIETGSANDRCDAALEGRLRMKGRCGSRREVHEDLGLGTIERRA